MGNLEQLEQLELDIKDAQRVIKLRGALNLLAKDTNFKLLIESEYFEQESIRLVQAKSNPALQSDEQQKFIHNSMLGIGALQQYFNKIQVLGEQAEVALVAQENTQAELLGMGD